MRAFNEKSGNGGADRVKTDGKTLIVGLGKTGLSCARYLASQGVSAAVTDSREQPPALEQLRSELPDTALFLGGFDQAAFAAAEQLVVSPGVSLRQPQLQAAIARGVPVIGDIELFARAVRAPVAAITGSNGKSTVTSLLGEMAAAAGLDASVGGNLGRPALDLLQDEAPLYLLELSSFQLETTHSLEPRVAVVLNVTADHMDRYDSLQSYAATKAKIYRRAATRVYNRDDPLVLAMSREDGDARFFTLDSPAEGEFGVQRREGVDWLAQGSQPLLRAAELRIPGRHNQANALAALALGAALNLPMEAMLEALRRFPGLPHRTQFVAEHQGVRWYNDSKGTNPGACIAALQGLHDDGTRVVLIAGGDSKGADFSPLLPVVADSARAVVLIGRDAPAIEQALATAGVPLLHASDMDRAVQLAARQALPGDRVLLSPACASFDMFSGYEQRGQVFMDAVWRMFS
jgi:UDP-N-acetylmuramoylalanine--D-glutamate ligase